MKLLKTKRKDNSTVYTFVLCIKKDVLPTSWDRQVVQNDLNFHHCLVGAVEIFTGKNGRVYVKYTRIVSDYDAVSRYSIMQEAHEVQLLLGI